MEYLNEMQKPGIEKVVVHICVGKSGEELVKAETLLSRLTNTKTVRTLSTHRIPAWGLKKGEPIGCKATLRNKAAKEFLDRALVPKDRILKKSNFDKFGNLAFGIHEYIDLPGIKYDPEIGIFGMNVNATIERPGYRIKKRHLKNTKVPAKNMITQEESMEFMAENFKVKFEE
ncbi:MAG: 50S ribosomal protein L5 [Candidatus Altiarchaeales archaeon HGW-Altiarchaeales-3]|nr:MAG: 50S ribosomal protein L5 [Candidatus Altiarchaeales archaeon HGW-Altiarchaeales-3]